MSEAKKKAKTISPSMVLKQKIGAGPLDPQLVERAQRVIEENNIDFAPLGLQFLTELSESLDNVEAHLNADKFESQKRMLTEPVMELKANATIFHYSLVGNLAEIMLSFLESISEIDKDALSIVRSHHDSLKAIISNKMKGDGGSDGKIMMTELQDACSRYYKKRKKQE